jgi:hypothetical protein
MRPKYDPCKNSSLPEITQLIECCLFCTDFIGINQGGCFNDKHGSKYCRCSENDAHCPIP